MTEIEDALRSCMEQLLLVREEREQIIIDGAKKISAEQKKVRDLEQKLAEANKRIAKFGTENNNLYDIIETKDKLIRELKESKALSNEKLADVTTRLELTQKQSSSLKYEVCMLQKELEIRNKERDYDLKSADAAYKQQTENIKKIAKLEAECQRLRTMVRKRLPGPAALAKMKNEVEQPGTSPVETRIKRPNSAAPLSPRPSTPRDFASENYFVKLRAIEDENKLLKQSLAKKDSELQFVQIKYADEACKLSAVQRQLKELSKEQASLNLEKRNHLNSKIGGNDDTDSCSESWASALISELENFKSGKQGASCRSIAASDISLLDDLMEIEKLEMASVNQTLRPSSTPRFSVSYVAAKDTDSRTAVSESTGKELIPFDSLSDNYPEWLQDILKLIIHKHQVTEKGIDVILEEVTRALKRSDIYVKGESSNMSYNQSKIEKMVSNLIEKVKGIERSAENNEGEHVFAGNARSLLLGKSEFTARMQYFVRVCGDLRDGKANVEMFIDELCLILEWIMNHYFSHLDGYKIMENSIKNCDGDESFSVTGPTGRDTSPLNAYDELVMLSAKSPSFLEMQSEAQKWQMELTEGKISDQVLINYPRCQLPTSKLDEEIAAVTLEGGDNTCPERMLTYSELKGQTESFAADGNPEDFADQDEKPLRTNSEMFAAAEKLAECQETITNLSKQLPALASPTNVDPLDTGMSNPRPSTTKSDYRPQSLRRILAEEDANITKSEDFSSPTSEEVICKKEHGKPDEAEKNLEADSVNDQDADTGHSADNNDSTQIIPHPMFSESLQAAISLAPKKKKRGASLLGRLIFGRKAESSQKPALPINS